MYNRNGKSKSQYRGNSSQGRGGGGGGGAGGGRPGGFVMDVISGKFKSKVNTIQADSLLQL